MSARTAGRIGFLTLAGMLAVVGHANAQVFLVRPALNARLTYTDNAGASRDRDEDWIAEISPSVAMLRRQGRITGNLNARLRHLMYARDSDRDSTFVALQGRGQVEAVEDVLFLDMGALISRDNTSALNGRSSDDFLSTDSANETRLFSFGPRLHFRLGGGPSGAVSYLATWFEGGGATVGRTVDYTRATLGDAHAFGRVGWQLDYTRTDTRYDDASDIDSSRTDATSEFASATALMTVSPQLRLRGLVGYESNDYETRSGEDTTVTGYGFEWMPTPRTTVSGMTQDRVFGRSYDFSLSHRRALSSWNVSYSRDISSSAVNAGVFDDPAFRSLYDSLQTQIPDPFVRENVVRQQLGYPPIGLRDVFVTNNYFVARTLRGAVSLIGARNVLSFTVQRTERERLGDPLVNDPRDDLATFGTVKSRSATVSLSHRLSPDAAATANLLRSYATGSRGASAETRRTVLSLGLNSRLGASTNGGLTYRHQRTTGRGDFSENILSASLSMQF